MAEHRRSGFDPLRSTAHGSRAPVVLRGTPQPFTVRVGGRQLEMNYGPKCKVCNSPWRRQIDQQLAFARGYKLIVDQLPPEAREVENPINAQNIRDHVRAGHLPIREAMAHAMASERAVELGVAMEEMQSTVIDYMLLGRTMMDRYFTALVSGDEVPSGSDITTVMRMFAQIDAQSEGSLDTAVYNEVIAIMLETIKEVAPTKYDEIAHRVGQHPVVRGLIEQRRQQQSALGPVGS